jgi:hypothetical protein
VGSQEIIHYYSNDWVIVSTTPVNNVYFKSYSVETGELIQLTDPLYQAWYRGFYDGWIYYEYQVGQDTSIFRIHPNGSDLEQLTQMPGWEDFVAVSNGWLMFNHQDGNTYRVQSGEVWLLFDTHIVPLTWLNQQELLYGGFEDSNIGIVDVATGDKRLLHSSEDGYFGYLDTIGEWIYYRGADTGFHLYRMHISGAPTERLTDFDVTAVRQRGDLILITEDATGLTYTFDGEEVNLFKPYPADIVGWVPAPEKSWSPPLLAAFGLMGLAVILRRVA